MASKIGLSNPQIVINNVVRDIFPDSFKFKDGSGEIKVRALSAGGDSVDSIHTIDVATKISFCEFEVGVTSDERNFYSNCKSNIAGNVLQGTFIGGGSFIMVGASQTNEIEWAASSDGKAKVEFRASPSLGS